MCVLSFTWLGFYSRLNWASVWLWICRFWLGRWAGAAHESSPNLTLLSSQASCRQRSVSQTCASCGVKCELQCHTGVITAPGSVYDISEVWPRITVYRGHLCGWEKVLNPTLCVCVLCRMSGNFKKKKKKKHLKCNTGQVWSSKNDLVCEPQPSIFTESLNSQFKTHKFTHQSTLRCKLLMLRATVSFVKSEQSGPLSPAAEIRLPTCRRAPLLLCLLLFHDGVTLHLDAYRQLPGCGEEILGGGDFWDARPGHLSSVTGPCSLTLSPWCPLCGFRKILQTAGVTHWQAVITGAPYCVSTLKVIRVSVCLNVLQSSPDSVQAASVVAVRLNTRLFKWGGTLRPVGLDLIFFWVLYQHLFSSPIVLICRSWNHHLYLNLLHQRSTWAPIVNWPLQGRHYLRSPWTYRLAAYSV